MCIHMLVCFPYVKLGYGIYFPQLDVVMSLIYTQQ